MKTCVKTKHDALSSPTIWIALDHIHENFAAVTIDKQQTI